MNTHKKVIVSAIISFVISTFIFIITFNILSWYSLVLSYFTCGFMLFLFIFILVDKLYKKDKSLKYSLITMPSVVILAICLSILVYDYCNQQDLDMNLKIVLAIVGIVATLGVFLPILFDMLFHIKNGKK